MAGSNFDLSVTIKAVTGQFVSALGAARDAVSRFFSSTEDAARPRDELGRFVGTAKEVEGAAESMGRSFDGLKARIAAAAAGYLSFQALKDALLGLVKTGTEMETLQKKLDAIMGSIEGGQRASAWIKDFAATTPLSLEQVTEGFVRLKAFGIDPMGGAYQALVDQAVKLGGSQETLEGIVAAVGQAWSKQKLQTEEALQLLERGVPVWDLLEKALGKNATQLQEMASAGQLGREAIAALVNEMSKASAGTAQASMDSMSGIVSNLADTFTEAKDQFVKAGFFDAVKAGLQDVQTLLGYVVSSGLAKQWGQQFGEAVTSMATYVEGAFRTFEGFVAGLRLSINAFSAGINTIGEYVAGGIGKIITMAGQALDFVGADEMAAKAKAIGEAFADASGRYAEAVRVDAEDMGKSWASLNGALSEQKSKIKELMAVAKITVTQVSDAQVAAAKAAGKHWSEMAKGAETATKQVGVTLDAMAGKAQTTADKVAAAFKTLGAKTDADLRVAADEALKHFETIRDSGTASAQEISRAYDAYAEKAKAANNGVLPAMVAAQQQALQTAAAIGTMGSAAQAGGQGMAQGAQQVQQAVEGQAQGTRKAADATAGLAQAQSGAADVAAHMAEVQEHALSMLGKYSAAAEDTARALLKSADSWSDGAAQIGALATEARRFVQDNPIGELERQIREYEAGAAEAAQAQKQLNKYIQEAPLAWKPWYEGLQQFARFEQALAEAAAAEARMELGAERMGQALEALQGKLDSGEIGLQDYTRRVEALRVQYGYLGEERLRPLLDALAEAKQRTEELMQSAQDTLDGIQDRLDRMHGDEVAVAMRDRAKELADLQKQLDAAIAAGNVQAQIRLKEAIALAEQYWAEYIAGLQKADQEAGKSRLPGIGDGGIKPPNIIEPMPVVPGKPGGTAPGAPVYPIDRQPSPTAPPTQAPVAWADAVKAGVAEALGALKAPLEQAAATMAASSSALQAAAARPVVVAIDSREVARAVQPELAAIGARSK